MSASLDVASDWNFRVFDKRLIIVKTKNDNALKAAVLDVLTNIPFTIEMPNMLLIQELKAGQNFLANLRVYTSKNLEGIDKDFTDFFEAIDIDQNIEDFIKAYWIYPTKIRFELTDLEEP